MRIKDFLNNFIIKRNNFVLILILISAFILRVYNLGKFSLWYDEAVLASGELGFLQWFFSLCLKVTKLHYLILLYHSAVVFYWQNLFGYSEFALRLSSVIFGLLSIAILYMLAKEIFNVSIAQLSIFLLAISPWHIYYSQELSVYAATCFFSLLSVYMLFKILKVNRIIYWAIYTMANIVNIYFHYTILITLLVFMLFLLWHIKNDRKLLKIFAISHGLIFIFIMPCFLNIYSIIKYMLFFANKFNRDDFQIFWTDRVNWCNILFTLKNLSIGYNTSLYDTVGFSATFTFMAFFGYGIYGFWKDKKKLFLLLCVFIHPLSFFLVSQIKVFYVDRYFFHSLPLYILGTAIGISKLKKKLFCAVIGLIVIFTFFGLNDYYSNRMKSDQRQRIAVHKKRDMDIREAVKYISKNFKSQDTFLHTNKSTVYPLKFYSERYANNTALIQKANKGTMAYYSDETGKITTLGHFFYYPPLIDVDNPMDLKTDSMSRIWLVFSFWDPVSDFPEYTHLEGYKVIEQLSKGFKHIRTNKFNDFIVYLFYN